MAASEAPRGKPRGNLLRRSSLGYAGRVFAEPSDLSAEAIRAKGEAKDAILSCHSSFGATKDPPCGNLPAVLRTALQAGPQGFLAKEGEINRRMTPRERLLAQFLGVKPDRPAWLADLTPDSGEYNERSAFC